MCADRLLVSANAKGVGWICHAVGARGDRHIIIPALELMLLETNITLIP